MQNEEKRKRIIAAFTVSGVILIVILFAVVIYQIVEISVLSERRSKLRQEYEQICKDYETARLAYEAIGGGKSGSAVKAPMTGYLKNIMVKDGDFVEMGQPLMTLSQNRRLQLRAEVPQRYYSELPSVVSANFKTPYDKKYDKILRNLLTVEGRSFAEPVLTPDGKEDYAKSRRVELKLRVQGNTLTKVFGLSFGDN